MLGVEMRKLELTNVQASGKFQSVQNETICVPLPVE
jgi:hypothetical protein